MQQVSEQYKQDFYKDGRNRSFIEIQFTASDNEVENATFVASEVGLYTNEENMEVNKVAQYTYATLEPNRWKLDGNMLLAPTEEEIELMGGLGLYTGYTSESIADEEGIFQETVALTIEFPERKNFAGVRITFEEPVDFRLDAYRQVETPDGTDTQIVYYEVVKDNTLRTYNIVHNFTDIDFISISMGKTNPNYRLRILGIQFGMVASFGNDSLTDNGVERVDEIDYLSRELPNNSFTFTVENAEGLYNFDNPNGIYEYLQENMPFTAKIGYQLDNGNIEWQNSGTYYLSEWSADRYTATFKGVAKANILRGNANLVPLSSTRLEEVSLYQIANNILSYAGLMEGVDYVIDSSLYNIYVKAPIPDTSIAEVLQCIAGASGCVLYTDKNDIVRIEKPNNQDTGYYLDFNSAIEEGLEAELEPPLKDIVVKWYTYEPAKEAQNIYTETIKLPEELYTYVVTLKEPADDIKVSISGNGELISSGGIYDRLVYALIRANNGVGDEVTISINGKPVVATQHLETRQINENGETCEIDNPLITTAEQANNIIDYTADYLTHRKIYSMDYIGEPAIDCLDNISLQTRFNDNNFSRVINNTIKFNGGLSGSIKVKVIG